MKDALVWRYNIYLRVAFLFFYCYLLSLNLNFSEVFDSLLKMMAVLGLILLYWFSMLNEICIILYRKVVLQIQGMDIANFRASGKLKKHLKYCFCLKSVFWIKLVLILILILSKVSPKSVQFFYIYKYLKI